MTQKIQSLPELMKVNEERREDILNPVYQELLGVAESRDLERWNEVMAKLMKTEASFLRQSQEEAYKLGEENMRERIREWARERIGEDHMTLLRDLLQELDKPKCQRCVVGASGKCINCGK